MGEREMANDPASKRKRFQVLLQQIGLTEDASMPFFQHAEITKLVVERQKKIWHFSFQFEKILPYELFIQFAQKLQQSFQHIASISFEITTEDSTITEDMVQAYWTHCIQELDGISPVLLSLLNNQVPQVNGNIIFINARNDTEVQTLKRKYSQIIQDIYMKFGFPPLQLDGQVMDQEETNDDYQKFLEAKQKEDEERAKQAVVEMQKQESEKEARKGNASGPLTIGISINPTEEIISLKNIVDEERRVTVEGYIFDAETRELRSGRTLLTFKITDYTDSILVKMFSRDKEDAETLKQVKKGMWVKARGSIQNDTFVRDLVMIANDINEVKPRERLDQAEEKRVELHLHTTMSQMDGLTSMSNYVAQAKK